MQELGPRKKPTDSYHVTTIQCTEKNLDSLPKAIWCAVDGIPSVYHGTPKEMVAQMFRELALSSSHLPLEDMVTELAGYYGIHFTGLEGVTVDTFAGIFVFALLQQGIGKTLKIQA